MQSEAKYYLPFEAKKQPVRISQGRNGPWSHFLHRYESPLRPGVIFETDLVNAVDFALTVGSEVRVTREGIVFDIYHGSKWFYEGLDPEVGNNPPIGSTNFVIVEHTDRTKAWYSHLNDQEVVQRGQRVKVGDLIAYTGKSGWVAEIPHLHFHVSTRSIPALTLPVMFEDYEGSLDHETLLREGKIWFGEK